MIFSKIENFSRFVLSAAAVAAFLSFFFFSQPSESSYLPVTGSNIGIGTSSPVGGLVIMNGNVGVGTWSPTQRLQVVGTVSATAFVGDGSGLTGINSGGWTDGGTNVYTSTTTDNVGIGTTTPNAATLEIVKNAAQPLLKMSSTAAGSGNYLIVDSAGNVGIGTTITSNAAFSVLSGNVGIGTWKPARAVLEVSGGSTAGSPSAIFGGAGAGISLANDWPQLGFNTYWDGGAQVNLANGYSGDITVNPAGVMYIEMSAASGTAGSANATTPSLTLLPGGNVGVGYFNPVNRLDVQGAMSVGGAYAGVKSAPANGLLVEGSVGIGTFTPTGVLDVRQDEVRIWTGTGTSTNATSAGELYVEGDLEVDGTIYGDGSGITGTIAAAGGWTDGGANVFTTTTTDLVAIGTTTPASTLTVKGNAGIGTTIPYQTIAAPANGMIVEGNVGIGTWSPNNRLSVVGNLGVGTTLPYRQISGPEAGLFVEGNVGIGTWAAPNGKLVLMGGNLGIGTASPQAEIEITGNLRAASTGQTLYKGYISGNMQAQGFNNVTGYALNLSVPFFGQGGSNPAVYGIYSAPRLSMVGGTGGVLYGIYSDPLITVAVSGIKVFSGVFMGGNVGVGTLEPNSRLVINGGVAIGTYLSSNFINTIAPSGGLIVENNVGIGTVTPEGALTVMNGNAGIGTWSPRAKLEVVGSVLATSFYGDGSGLTGLPAGGGWTDGGTNVYASTTTDNVGIGTTTPTAALLIENAGAQDSFRINDAVLDSSPFIVSANGNVGVGTTTPTTPLYVIGDVTYQRSGASTWITLTDFSGSNPNLQLSGADATVSTYITSQGPFNLMAGNVSPGSASAMMILYGATSGSVGIGTSTPVGGTAIMNGNVGIGTWSPANRLSISGNIGIGTTLPYRRIAAPNNGMVVEGNVGIGTWKPFANLQVQGVATADNVGIGTTSPQALLELSKGVPELGFLISLGGYEEPYTSIEHSFGADYSSMVNVILPGGDTVGGYLAGLTQVGNPNFMFGFIGATQRGSVWNDVGASGALQAGDYIPGLAFAGQTSTSDGDRVISAAINGIVDSTVSSGVLPTAINFRTSLTDSTGLTERMRITSRGNVGIGTSTPVGGLVIMNGNAGIGTWSPTQRLQVIGTVNATAFVGDGSGLTNLPGGSSGWTDGGTNVYTTTTTDNVGIGTTTTTAALLVENPGSQASFRVNDAVLDGSPFIIDAAGNIGIGTTTPSQIIEVSQTADPTIRIINSTSTYYTDISPNTISLYRPSGDAAIFNTGNTGNLILLGRDGSGNPREGIRINSIGAVRIGYDSNSSGPEYDVAFPGYYDVTVAQNRMNTSYGFNGANLTLMSGGAASGQTDRNGGILYLASGISTGTGTSQIQLQTATAGATGSTDRTPSTKMTILGTGNVGIGTTAPVGALTVMNGNVGIGTWSPTQRLQVIGTVNATAFVGDGSGLTNLPGGSSGWTDGGTNVYTSATTDNVGIGTTTPASTLTVAGNIGIGTFAAYRTIAGPNNGMVIEGNVGIGTWNPTAKLDLRGNIKLNDGTISDVSALSASANQTISAGNNLDVSATNYMTFSTTNGYFFDVPDGGTRTLVFSNISGGWDAAAIQATKTSGSNSNGTLTIRTTGHSLAQIFLDAVGNVGIGTTNPASKLTVHGAVGVGTSAPYRTTAAPASGMIIEGNVGIGTWASSNAKLAVLGGNVGIGHVNPNALFSVYDSSGGAADILFQKDSGGSGGALVLNDVQFGASKGYLISFRTGGNTRAEIIGGQDAGTNSYLTFNTSATNNALYINQAGNIGISTTLASAGLAVMNGNAGIGTWSPRAKLEVIGSVLATSFYGDGSNLTGISAGNSGWTDGGTNVYTTTTTDSVAIGTTTPTASLLIENLTAQDSFRVNDALADTSPFLIDSAGNVGIGTLLPDAQLNLLKTSTDATAATEYGGNFSFSDTGAVAAGTDNTYGTNLSVTRTGATGGTINVYGSNINVSADNAGAGSSTAYGQRVNISSPADTNYVNFARYSSTSSASTVAGNYVFMSTGNTTNSYGQYLDLASSTGTGTDFYGIYMDLSNHKLDLTNAYGIRIDAFADYGQTISNSYGIYLDDMGKGDNQYGIYAVSTNDINYFGSKIGIGTTTPVGSLAVMNGNVGIGTWSPRAKLEVIGSVLATSFYGDGSNLTGISAGNSGWTDGGTNVYTTTTTDNVGIGTTTPTAALLVENAGTQNSFRVNDEVLDASPFLIDSNGDVGIGTTVPAYKVDIQGPALADTMDMRLANTATAGVLNRALFDFSVNSSATLREALGIWAGLSTTTDASRKSIVEFKTASGGVLNTTMAFDGNNVGIGTADATGGKLIVLGGNVGVGTTTPVGALTVMNGNVGIGTWSPRAKLEVIGSVLATSFYGDGSNLTGISAGNSGWTDGGTNVYTSATTDNVGIGTTTPTAALLVENAGTQDSFRVNDAVSDGSPFVINSAGNIGIGTTAPIFKFHISAAAGEQAEFWVNRGGASQSGFIVSDDASRGEYRFDVPNGETRELRFRNFSGGNDAASIMVSHDFPTGTMTLKTAGHGLAQLYLDGVGNVGIGTTTTASNLVVNGGVGIGTVNASNFINTAAPAGGLIVEKNVGIGTVTPVGALTVMNGNVGIGTWSPTQRLQVVGTVSATTFVGDGSGLTGLPAGGGWTDGGTNVYTSTTTDNVAIGTTTPTAKLDVINGGGGIEIQLSDPGFDADLGFFVGGTSVWTLYAENDDSSFRFNRAGAMGDVLTISSSGNVGIGTVTPVNGTAIMNGNVGIGTWSPGTRLQVNNTASYVREYDNGNQAVNFTVDWNNANKQRVTLGAAGLTVTFTAPAGGVTNLMLKIIQDGSGSRTITSWPGTVRWPGGTAPTLTTTAGAVDIVTCYYDRTNYYCTNSLDFQ